MFKMNRLLRLLLGVAGLQFGITGDEGGGISAHEASSEFASFLGDEPEEKQAPAAQADADPDQDAIDAINAEAGEEGEAEAAAEEVATDALEIEVDGKPVKLTKAEIAEAYKGQLRQADYTRKTMDAANETKAAKAEREAAATERAQYSAQLQTMQQQLQGVLQEQSQIDWQELLHRDPVEYLNQKHLFDQRQAALQENQREQQLVEQRQQAEQAQHQAEYAQREQQALLAKLPAWKDEAVKAKEVAALAQGLMERGFNAEELKSLTDHRLILELNDAHKYRQLIAKAKTAAQKVAAVPAKVERPGIGAAGKVDGRTAHARQLAKTGSVRDAANVFADML